MASVLQKLKELSLKDIEALYAFAENVLGQANANDKEFLPFVSSSGKIVIKTDPESIKSAYEIVHKIREEIGLSTKPLRED